MLYLSETSGRDLQKETTKDVMEDEIDQLLKKRDGLIQRDRDPQLCHTHSLSSVAIMVHKASASESVSYC